MFDLALRAKGLASSNLNSLIALASNPAKMLKLLMAELEEAVIALARNAATLDRSAGKCTHSSMRQRRPGKTRQGWRCHTAARIWRAVRWLNATPRTMLPRHSAQPPPPRTLWRLTCAPA